MGNSAQHPTTDQVKAIIKQFAGQANTLVIPRVFIDFTGDHLAALLLSQILYWSDRTSDPDGWFYKTADEWEVELGMSGYQVKRAATALNKLGIETTLHKVKGAPRTHYRVDMPKFTHLFLQFLENQGTRKSTNYKMENQETAKSIDFQETAKTYKEHRLPETTDREGVVKNSKPLDELSHALFDLCLVDPDLAPPPVLAQLRKTYKSLRGKEVTQGDIRERFAAYWYSDDNWMARKAREAGRNPEPPTPEQVLTEWTKAMAWKPAKSPPKARQVSDLPTITAVSETKRVASPEDRRRIMEETRAKAQTGK